MSDCEILQDDFYYIYSLLQACDSSVLKRKSFFLPNMWSLDADPVQSQRAILLWGMRAWVNINSVLIC